MTRVNTIGLPAKFSGFMENVSYDFKGRIFLVPANLFEWGDLEVFDASGPKGFSLRALLEATGFNIYVGKKIFEMIRQNDLPLPLSRYTYLLNVLREEGHIPPPSDALSMGDFEKLEKVTLKSVPTTSQGYAAGDYRTALSLADAGHRHTLLTELSDVFVLTANQSITQEILPNIPSGTRYVGVWLTEVDTDTPYLQREVDVANERPATYVLDGPFRNERAQPTSNETFLGQSPRPDLSRQTAFEQLHTGEYQVRSTIRTAQGESLASEIESYSISGLNRFARLRAEMGTLPPAAVGWHCYILQDNGLWYRVHPSSQSSERALAAGQSVSIYSNDPGQWPGGWSVTQTDLPAVDTSGIPDPNFLTPVGTPFDNAPLSPGALYSAVTLAEGEDEQPPSDVNRITLGSGTALRAILRKRVQKFLNAEGTEIDETKKPLEWLFKNAAGVIEASGGEILYHTNGSQTGSTLEAASAVTLTDKSDYWNIRGEVEVVSRTAGAVEAVLHQYSTLTPTFGVTSPLVSTVIHSMDDVGTEEYQKIMAPADWNVGTLSHIVAYRFTGATKNLVSKVRHAAQFNHRHAPKKWIKALTGTAQADDPDVPPGYPFPEFPDASIGPPRTRPRQRPGVPLDTTFVNRPLSDGTLKASYDFDDGSLPSHPTVTIETHTGATVTAINAAAIDGAYGMRVNKTNTNTQFNGLWVDFSTAEDALTRTRLAGGAKFRINTMPTQPTDLVDFVSKDGSFLGTITLYATGEVKAWWMGDSDAPATFFGFTIFTGIANGSVLDLDYAFNGFGGKRGIVSVWGTKTGGAKQLMLRAENLDWHGTGHIPTKFGFGAWVNGASTIQVDVDSILITDAGQKWYRDHNVEGTFLNQVSMFVPKGQKKRQDIFITDVREAVKPGGRYALGVFFKYIGVVGVANPFVVTLHNLKGDTVQVGSITAPTAITGTNETFPEFVGEILVPDFDEEDPDNNYYEMRMTCQDMSVGTYYAQEFGMTELNPVEPLVVDRSRTRPLSGEYRITFDIRTPKGAEYSPLLPRRILRVGGDTEITPEGTSISQDFRSTPDLLHYSAYTGDVTDLSVTKFLETRFILTGDGKNSPVLTDEAPYVDMNTQVSTLLRDDNTELTGGAIVRGFQFPWSDPMIEVRMRRTGLVYKQPIAPPVKRLGAFSIQFFSEEAVTEFREQGLRKSWIIEAFGRATKINLTTQPNVVTQPATSMVSVEGDWYHVYATAEIEGAEVEAITWLEDPDEI